ncbi:MAG: peroxidase-related enzyme [Bacteroidales bacterium]|nr:peroxidase-related enzyme [Bacteroidales bacterium]
MAKIKTISYSDSTGRLREIYDDLIKTRGQLADVHIIQSLRPESIVKHMELYMEIMYSKSKLTRAEREMIAVICSISNNCEYCCKHHSAALSHYWKNEKKIRALLEDYKNADITPREMALCEFASSLTCNPATSLNTEYSTILTSAGFDDNEILDATLVVAYFNFVNRIVISLNVNIEENNINSYKF